jgi:hypothetical protein
MVGTNDFKFNRWCYGLPGSGIGRIEFKIIRRDGLPCACVVESNEFNFRCHGLSRLDNA